MRLLAAAGIALGLVGAACGGSSSEGPPPEDQPAGKVVEVRGSVSAERPGASGAVERRSLAVGDEVAGIDVIVTAADAAVSIRLDHNGARWTLDGGQRKQVSQSAAWRAPRQGGGEVLAGGTEDHTAAAGRHAEREAADTRATAGVMPQAEPGSAPAAQAAPVQAPPVQAPAPAPVVVPPPPPPRSPSPSGGTGTAMRLDEGKMGRPRAERRPPAKPAAMDADDDLLAPGGIGTSGRGGGSGPGYGGAPSGGSGDKNKDGTVVIGPDVKVQGSLAPEAVKRVFAARRGAFFHCWETSEHPAELKVSLKLAIGADGAVTAAEAQGADGPLAACLVKVARATRFPAPAGPVTIHYPLVFRAE